MNDEEVLDAVSLMERGHRTILALLEAYSALAAAQESAVARKAVADDICMEVTIQMRLESELLYPAARMVAPAQGRGTLGVAHAQTREQVAQLLGMHPSQAGYDAAVLALGRSIRHHVQSERERLFPAVRVSGVDHARLAQRVRERRMELQTVSEALREQAMLGAYA